MQSNIKDLESYIAWLSLKRVLSEDKRLYLDDLLYYRDRLKWEKFSYYCRTGLIYG